MSKRVHQEGVKGGFKDNHKDGFKKPLKKRVVEEVFFAKRQEKKAKRKFGDL